MRGTKFLHEVRIGIDSLSKPFGFLMLRSVDRLFFAARSLGLLTLMSCGQSRLEA